MQIKKFVNISRRVLIEKEFPFARCSTAITINNQVFCVCADAVERDCVCFFKWNALKQIYVYEVNKQTANNSQPFVDIRECVHLFRFLNSLQSFVKSKEGFRFDDGTQQFMNHSHCSSAFDCKATNGFLLLFSQVFVCFLNFVSFSTV